ncbi:MAG TPA: lysophospholipid acyltransferase family protein [Aestuariivirgaceae bacterium]|nr:lysophospholipid acyltransferase family protein [Aestuariivirgaceae bacterium]
MEPIRFSYSTVDQPLLQRAVIRAIEKLGGQPRLKRLYDRHVRDPRPGESFFDAAVRLLNLEVRFDASRLARVPRTGPVLFVANHPYGVLDGIVLAWLAMKVRPDVKVLAHSVLCQAPEARANLMPVDFSPTHEARATTLQTRRRAQDWLQRGQAVAIFPGGGVSISARPLKGPAIDFAWAPFTEKLVRTSKAVVVPVCFMGQNSRLFQLASHLSMTLRLSLMFRETTRRIGTRLDVRVGPPIPYDELAGFTGRSQLIAELRRRTFSLAIDPDGVLSPPGRYLRPVPLKVYRKPELLTSSRRSARG